VALRNHDLSEQQNTEVLTMKMRKFGFCSLLTLLALFASGTANAKTETYTIDVTVTGSPYGGEDSYVKQWSFCCTPETYSGWFTADDTIAGPISNLHLIIGGVDLAKNFSISASYFDPSSLELSLAATDSIYGNSTAPNSLILFGNFSLPPAPKSTTSNYVAAVEPNHEYGTLDAVYGVTQNWFGTLIVTACTASYH
jgi:hypothetical protein